jgi:hypothetical protein
VLTALRWVSLHIGLRSALRATPPADRWRLYHDFTRAHRASTAAVVLMIRIYRSLEGRAPEWARRDRADSR